MDCVMDERKINYEAEILQAVSHPSRLRILYHLMPGRKCSCELRDELKIEQSNLSRHLSKMVQAGVLLRFQNGSRVEYEIASEEVRQLIELVQTIARRRLKEMIALYETPETGAIIKDIKTSRS